MQVKRVYDIIPNNRGLVLDGPLARNMKVHFLFLVYLSMKYFHLEIILFISMLKKLYEFSMGVSFILYQSKQPFNLTCSFIYFLIYFDKPQKLYYNLWFQGNLRQLLMW